MARIFGLSIGDGKLSLVTRHADGLSLSVMGLDPRGTNEFGSGEDIEAGDLAQLFVVPTPVTLPTGGATFEFIAIGYDEDGHEASFTPVWSIVEAADAVIDPDTGILTTGAGGEEEVITVRATVGAITADADVTIADLVVDEVIVSPPGPWSMAVGETKQFSAIGMSGGDIVSISPVWSVESGVGSISPSGLYTAGTTPGSAVIRATQGAEFDEVSITVSVGAMVDLSITPVNPTLDPAEVQAFTAVGLDAYDNPITLVALSVPWSCSAGGSIVSTTVPTANLTAGTPSPLIITEYTNAIRAEYGGFVAFQSFTVDPTE